MIFADAAPPDHANWLTNLQFFATVITGLIVLWSMLTNKPQKREVSFEQELITKADFDKHSKDDSTALKNIDDQLESLRTERKNDADGLHDRITSLAREVSAVQVASEFTNQRLVQIDGKLDRAIERNRS